ncbi:MAG: tyrosine-protein phosphatase [Cyclobacteriaceae bacterium]
MRPLLVDMHSHLIPDVDDGVDTVAESLEILIRLSELGYQKAITTPHVMGDYYPNDINTIKPKLNELQELILQESIDIEIEAAAEYYLDEHFMQLLQTPDQLLTFGANYLLIETSFINEPAFLREGIFQIISAGLQPVLAHPERYVFIQNDPEIAEDLVERGVLLQLNLLSLTGYYSKAARKVAEKLIDQELVSFAGSDCHNIRHLSSMTDVLDGKYYKKLMQLELLNNTL